MTLLVYVLEGCELVDPTTFWRSQIFSLKILLARLQHCRNSGFVSLQLSSSLPNQVFAFIEIQPPKKFDLGLNRCAPGGHKFLCKQIFKTPTFAETLISSREGGERISPCESCSNQVNFDTMLIFHMLDQIQQCSVQNHNSISRITDRNKITRLRHNIYPGKPLRGRK